MKHFLSRFFRTTRLARIAVGVGLLIGASACTSNSYMGISLLPDRADLSVQKLAARAAVGDKDAQLKLGIRFEEGNGVVQNRSTAIKLYEHSARAEGETVWVYTPSVGNGTIGRVIQITENGSQPGNPTARERLIKLRPRP